MRAQYWRGLDLYSPNRQDRVLVIGAGHIGSFITYYLARLGVKDITVVDFDVVEPHNLPHQFLAESLLKDVPEDAKILKVDILKQSIDFMVRDANIKCIPSKIEDAYQEVMQNPPDVVFSCADGMKITEWIYNNFKVCSPLFIDARTGGQYVNIYSIMPKDYLYYERSFYSDEETIPLPCTGTAIIDVAAAASAEAVNRFRLWTNDILKIGHTFHDYSTGVHSVMQFSRLTENKPVITSSNNVMPNDGTVSGITLYESEEIQRESEDNEFDRILEETLDEEDVPNDIADRFDEDESNFDENGDPI